jgi:hypothetical protein
MDELISERITVEKAETSPRPLRFVWRGEEHEVVAVLREWVDISFGGPGSRGRKWYNRRHRRHYVVKDAENQVFEIYLDYANRKKPTWWLLERSE